MISSIKKIIFIHVLCLVFTGSMAQEKFPLAWKADHGFKATLCRTWDDYGTLFIGASEKEISVIGKEGKSLWRFKFQEKGFKEAKEVWYYNNGVVEVTYKPADKKSQEDIVVLYDVQNGNELWKTGNDENKFKELIKPKPQENPVDNSIPFASLPLKKVYGTKIRRDINVTTADYGSFVVYRPGVPFSWGKEVSSEIYIPEKSIEVNLNYKRKLLRAAIGKTTVINITASKGGTQLWSSELKVKIVSTLVSDEDMIDFFVSQNKVFVVYEGISVLDLSTGKLLWTSDFNNSEVSVGLKARQELNIADMPLVTDDGVYIADLTSETFGIKKCDLETGNVLWKSPKYSSSDVIPYITIQGGVVLAKFGGIINVQSVITNPNNGAETYKTEFKMRGKAGIKAFDSKTGKVLWDEKKLGDKIDFISDLIQDNGKVSFFSDKAFYTIDLKSGDMLNKVVIKELKVDKAIAVWSSDDGKLAYAVYDNGIFAVDLASGKTKYELKVNDVYGVFKRGNRYFLQIGEDLNKLVSFDLEEGKLKGKMDDAYKRNVTVDGQNVIKINWGEIEKYTVK